MLPSITCSYCVTTTSCLSVFINLFLLRKSVCRFRLLNGMTRRGSVFTVTSAAEGVSWKRSERASEHVCARRKANRKWSPEDLSAFRDLAVPLRGAHGHSRLSFCLLFLVSALLPLSAAGVSYSPSQTVTRCGDHCHGFCVRLCTVVL